MSDVLRILQATSRAVIDLSDVRLLLRGGCAGRIASVDGRVVACLFSSAIPSGRRVDIIAVDPDHQRTGIGRLLLKRLRQSLSRLPESTEIHVLIRESLLPVQLFFRACGFHGVQTIPADGAEPQYLFAMTVLVGDDGTCW